MKANVEQGTVKELLMLFTQEEAATCKATLLLTPTAFSPGWSEGVGAQRPLVYSKGAVDHRIVRRHANTDINPETSDRHHRSRIEILNSLMRLRYGVEKSNEVLIDQ